MRLLSCSTIVRKTRILSPPRLTARRSIGLRKTTTCAGLSAVADVAAASRIWFEAQVGCRVGTSSMPTSIPANARGQWPAIWDNASETQRMKKAWRESRVATGTGLPVYGFGLANRPRRPRPCRSLPSLTRVTITCPPSRGSLRDVKDRRCTKTGCGNVAVATLTYAYADSMAVVGPLALRAEPGTYDLCSEHTLALRIPRGWELVRLPMDDESPKHSQDDLVALADAVRAAGFGAIDEEPQQTEPQVTFLTGRRKGHLAVVADPGENDG